MKITVEEAAKRLNVSQQFIRIGLQQGTLPIGSAVKMSSRWTYHISEERLVQYMGTKIPPPAATDDGKPPMVSRQKGQGKDNTDV